MEAVVAQEEYRLLATSLLLSRFTKAELAKAAGANPNTTASWLNRNRRYFVLDPTESQAGTSRGRPRKLWCVREAAAGEMRQELGKLDPAHRLTIADLPGDGPLKVLRRVEAQLEAWRRSVSAGDDTAAAEQLIATRSWVRMAWEDFAELEGAGFEVPSTQLRQLAELERETGAGALPEVSPLPQVTIWLTKRLSAMTDRGVSLEFASRTVRVRSEVRSEAERVMLTAASSAAPVWCDEGLAEENGFDVDAIKACKVVAEQVPPSLRVVEVAAAIGRAKAWSYCESDEEAQAVVLGLATQFGRVVDHEVGFWLAGLHARDEWRPELAPAVIRGLAEAQGVIRSRVMNSIANSISGTLRDMLEGPPLSRSHPGKVRTDAWEYCRKAVETNVVGKNRRELAFEFGSTLAYRPTF